jgi:mRNA interferase RelE/StbE
MTWKINFTKSADKDFSKLPKNIQARIVFYIKEKVLKSPRQHGKSLVSSPKIKLWRYRVENYRIICQIDDKDITILVVKIGKRDSVYKDHS